MHGIDTARARGQHQRTTAKRQRFVGVGAALEQRLNDGGITARRRQPQRGGTVAIRQVRLGAGLQQQFDKFGVATIGGPLQGGGTIGLLRIYVGTAFQQALNLRPVARACGIGNVSLRERGAGNRRQQHATDSLQCKATHDNFSSTPHTRPGSGPVLSPKLSRWMPNWSRTLNSRLPVGTCLVGNARWRLPGNLP